eukprot:TRINITY_DN1486_c0_g1_i1.p1 TRINITY_DN1486_c0_g1~~TRINITY_DN1486_c0_g1_i1.p1  ORF type:complete len:508 (-),score=193.18 TRINITY_DN1486_c0_g1_i1:136-1659(-)
MSLSELSKWQINSNEVTYQQKDIIGQGSFGTVFKGLCRRKQVAIKKIKNVSTATICEIVQEVSTMSQTLHPNVLLLMGICTEHDNFMIITEYMKNGSVADLLFKPQGKAMDGPHKTLYGRLLMAKKAAKGLSWLHGCHPPIIHRDLKTSNLLVDENFVVKVCDFGMAARIEGISLKGHCGTPIYMAPEGLLNNEFQLKSDIYSFGMILWEMIKMEELLNTSPFTDICVPQGLTKDEAIKEAEKQFTELVANRGRRPPTINFPQIMANLLHSCWENNPDNRPDIKTVIDSFIGILIEAATEDPRGRHFWHKIAQKKKIISDETFIACFNSEVRNNYSNELNHLLRLNTIIKQKIATSAKPSPKGHISITEFGNLLSWFGPFPDYSNSNQTQNFVARIFATLGTPGFHFDADKNDAAILLANKPIGTYLLRFSNEPGFYSMTFVKAEGIKHFRIQFLQNFQHFTCAFSFAQQSYYSTLADCCKTMVDLQQLTQPILCEKQIVVPENSYL